MPDEPRRPQGGTTLEMIRGVVESVVPRSPIRSVAVVGNAPLQPSAARAAEIDAADCVIRVNGFRTDSGGEPSVGRRTDVVVFTRGTFATPWLFHEYRKRVYLLCEPARMHWEGSLDPTWWPEDLGYLALPNREVAVPASAGMGIDLYTEPHWPTTGTIAIWVGMHLVPGVDVRLTGFSFLDRPDQTQWTHATGADTSIPFEHRLSDEAAMVRGWIDDKRARVL